MLPLFLYILLGFVQGTLEWLPVSSEGQIVLIGLLFSNADEVLILSLAFWLHFGTLIAVIFVFRDEWLKIIDLRNKDMDYMRKFLVITTIGTAIVGIPIKLILLQIIQNDNIGIILTLILGIALIGTGILLSKREELEIGEEPLQSLSTLQMLIVGFGQGLAIIPGVSRSGTTISLLLYLRINSKDAFKGSFFMSVPAVLGAITLDLLDFVQGDNQSILSFSPLGLTLAIGVSAIFGILTMNYLLKIADEYKFSNILLLLGGIVLLYVIVMLLF